MSKKVILAYSGGLDTSCCLVWLEKQGFKVITYTADLGQEIDFKKLKDKANLTGLEKVYSEDLKPEFAEKFVLPALKAGAVYESKYFLATALGRPLIAKKLTEVAKKEGAQYIAHGCSGKGNDQVRLEISAKILNPKLKIVAPLREWNLKTREQEIRYARKHNVPVAATKKSPYSIDSNLWGRSIECGPLEDIKVQPPEVVFKLTKSINQAPAKPLYIKITFDKGKPAKLNGKKYNLVELIKKLNSLGGLHAVGRSDLVEDRLVGIKTREVYEAPAAVILHTALRELEALVLDKATLKFKRIIADKYAELIYNGLWFSPLKNSLDAFIETTVAKLSGTLRLKLHKGNCICVGRDSKYSLYKKEMATYGKKDLFDRTAAEGFIKIWGMPYVK